MSSLPQRPRRSVADYALAVIVLFVLPLSLAILVLGSARDTRLFQFAVTWMTPLASIAMLAVAVWQWNRNRAVAQSNLLLAAGAALIVWAKYAPDLGLILGIGALVAVASGFALIVSAFLRQRRRGT